MSRPKPPEPHHDCHYRMPVSLWKKLAKKAANERCSANTLVIRFVKAGLVDWRDYQAKPEVVIPLPWLDKE